MRIRPALVLSALPAVLVAAMAVRAAEIAGPVVFEHVNLVRVQDGTVARDVTLAIADGRVASADRIPPHARRIDAHGTYVIPGLWDMHVHVNEDATWMLPLAAAMGVVGMRDMGGSIAGIRRAAPYRGRTRDAARSGVRTNSDGRGAGR